MDPFEDFPQGVSFQIQIVFSGEYRIGFTYKEKQFIPGLPKYFPFDEAVAYAESAFEAMFPSELLSLDKVKKYQI